MTVTYDQFLETITQEREPEVDNQMQGNVHFFIAAMYLWQQDTITNAEIIALCNFVPTDPELVLVKTQLNLLNKSDTLALEMEFRLAEGSKDNGDPLSVTSITWNKSRLRVVSGLSA